MPTQSGHTSVILASKVVGTPVYVDGGVKLGYVLDVMLDKLSGRLVCAVLVSQASSSTGQRYLPLPWTVLDFDPSVQGYVVGLTEHQLRNAPMCALDELTADDGVRARELMGQFSNGF